MEVEVQHFAYWTLVVDIRMYHCLVGEPSIKTSPFAMKSVCFGHILCDVEIPSIGWCVCFVFASLNKV